MDQFINHIALVLDASDSMRHLTQETVRVADQQIKDMADLSTRLDQETRATVYTFSDEVTCIFYDKDVLRLPSIADNYRTLRATALIDATLKAIEDLEKTATLYGDHAFLVFVQTDGEENVSTRSAKELQQKLKSLPANWTMACLVPNQKAKFTATSYGFPPENVAVWDATSEAGMKEAGRTIRAATESYMTSRSSGVVGTKALFTMDATAVNHKTVTANLKELNGFRVEKVTQPSVIQPFIEGLKPKVPFVQGSVFFPLIKRERINENKEVIIRHKVSGKIYGGPAARRLVGLPDTGEVSVSPQPNLEYDVFVQSTSLNRKLIPGHEILIKV